MKKPCELCETKEATEHRGDLRWFWLCPADAENWDEVNYQLSPKEEQLLKTVTQII